MCFAESTHTSSHVAWNFIISSSIMETVKHALVMAAPLRAGYKKKSPSTRASGSGAFLTAVGTTKWNVRTYLSHLWGWAGEKRWDALWKTHTRTFTQSWSVVKRSDCSWPGFIINHLGAVNFNRPEQVSIKRYLQENHENLSSEYQFFEISSDWNNRIKYWIGHICL